jgi:hypothetical protein
MYVYEIYIEIYIYNYHHYERGPFLTFFMHYNYIVVLKIHHNAALIIYNVTLLLHI